MSVQTHRLSIDVQRAVAAEFPVWQVSGIAENRQAEVPQVDANLIGSSCDRFDFQHGCAIRHRLQHSE